MEVLVTETSLFFNNRTQAVRLPKAVAFPEDVRLVDIRVVGNSRVITPVGQDWSYWQAEGTPVTDDFCTERAQPELQERNWTN